MMEARGHGVARRLPPSLSLLHVVATCDVIRSLVWGKIPPRTTVQVNTFPLSGLRRARATHREREAPTSVSVRALRVSRLITVKHVPLLLAALTFLEGRSLFFIRRGEDDKKNGGGVLFFLLYVAPAKSAIRGIGN